MADSSRPSDDRPRPVLAATAARQGRYGRHVFWVLVISTLLAAIGLFAAWGWKAPDLTRASSQQTMVSKGAAGAFHAPEPAPITPAPGTDHTAPQTTAKP
jgi:hypothetical protein